MLDPVITQSHIRLRMLREAFTLNKTQFAILIDTPYRTLINWEKYDRRMSYKACQILINIGINPNYVSGDENLMINGFTLNQVKKNILNRMMEKRSA